MQSGSIDAEAAESLDYTAPAPEGAQCAEGPEEAPEDVIAQDQHTEGELDLDLPHPSLTGIVCCFGVTDSTPAVLVRDAGCRAEPDARSRQVIQIAVASRSRLCPSLSNRSRSEATSPAGTGR